jgi:hypothetical protein
MIVELFVLFLIKYLVLLIFLTFLLLKDPEKKNIQNAHKCVGDAL